MKNISWNQQCFLKNGHIDFTKYFQVRMKWSKKLGKNSSNQLYLTDFTKFFAQVSPTIISEKQLAIFVVLRQIREPILIILLYNWHLMLLFLLILMRLCRFFWTVLSQTIIFLFAYKIEKKDLSLRSLQKYAGSN